MKKYTLNDINTILVDYINENKNKYGIDYLDTIKTFEDLLKEIKRDYETLKHYQEQEDELTL